MEANFIRSLGKIESSMAYNHELLVGNTQGCQMVKVDVSLSYEIVYDALRILFDEYEALRVSLRKNGDEFKFYSMENFSDIPVSVEECDYDVDWNDLLEKEVNNIIDPELYVWRFSVYVANKQSYVIPSFHHSIVDGSGVIVFLNRFLDIVDNLLRKKPSKVAPVAKSFPKAVDAYLKERVGNSPETLQGVKPNQILYQSGTTELSDRKTKMEVLSIFDEDYTAFIDVCKSKRMSVNGVLASMLVKSCHEEGLYDSVVELKSAISLRDRSPNFEDDKHELGCYITVANCVFDLSANQCLESLCKSYDSQLFRAMLKDVAYINPMSTSNMKSAIARMEDLDCFAQGIGITNAGVVETKKHDSFEILDWQTINNRCGGNVCIVLHAIQVNTRMNLGFVYSTPLITQENVKRVVQRFESEMLSLIFKV